MSQKTLTILIFIALSLFQVTSIGQTAPDWLTENSGTKSLYFAQTVSVESTPTLTIQSEGEVRVKWFLGGVVSDFEQEWDDFNKGAEGNITIHTEGKTLGDYTLNGLDYYEFNLEGKYIHSAGTVWVSIKTQDGNLNYELKTQPIPGNSVEELAWNIDHRIFIRGADLSLGYGYPRLEIDVYGGISAISFYRGLPGDRSDLIYSPTDFNRPPWNGSVVPFTNYIQGDTTYVYARVTTLYGELDSPPIYLGTVEPEDVELVNWPDSINSADVGSEVSINPEFNLSFGGAMYVEIYHGETGDTSNLVKTIDTGQAPIIKITVPEQPTNVWLRFIYGDLVLDSPPISVSPLPITLPKLTDQPDDLVYPKIHFENSSRGTVSAIGWKLGAIGGNLKFLWFQGYPGDFSTQLESKFAPIGEGNIRALDVHGINPSEPFYALIWNSEGTISSRACRVHLIPFEEGRLLNQPLRVRLTATEAYKFTSNNGYDNAFWAKNFFYGWDDVQLLRKENENWVIVVDSRFSGNGSDGSFLNISNTPFSNFTTGTYKYRAYEGEKYMDSTPFEVINEVLDRNPLEVEPAAWPVITAGQFTNGGSFSARIFSNTNLTESSVRIYAGDIGDRSISIPINSIGSNLDAIIDPSQDYGMNEFDIEWDSMGHEMYWFEASTANGAVVRTILRYPDEGKVSSSKDGAVRSILIPPGSDVIPIPNLDSLPDITEWRFGEGNQFGSQIKPPLKLSDLLRPNLGITLWNDEGEPVELMDIEVDLSLPPQILQTRTKAAVLPDGRVIWTASVNGDVSQSIAYAATDDGDWEQADAVNWKISEGFKVPESATRLKIEYRLDGLMSEATYELSRIPQDFLTFMEVSKTRENTLVTERMGTFLEAQEYPLLKHAELGWMYVHPYEGGIIFLGDTEKGGLDWNWTHPDFFPCIYNFRSQSWKYYWINGYGWFRDYNTGNWYNLN